MSNTSLLSQEDSTIELYFYVFLMNESALYRLRAFTYYLLLITYYLLLITYYLLQRARRAW